MTNKGSILIIVAGVFWGSMGLFTRELNSLGFGAIQIAAMRLFLAGVIFFLITLIKDPKGIKIKKNDIPLFLGLGLGSILFFTICYFTALEMMSMSTAAILLYTSPIWVMLMSVIVFKERITAKKAIALVLAFSGCVLVSGLGGNVSLFGVVIGLCAGLGYGLYSILGTIALRKYSPYTVTTYTFLIAGIGGLCICDLPTTLNTIATNTDPIFVVGFVILTAAFTAVTPFLCYTLGLKTTEASKAAILATVEPMVATILGILVYSEMLTVTSALGILCVLGAVILLNIKTSKEK